MKDKIPTWFVLLVAFCIVVLLTLFCLPGPKPPESPTPTATSKPSSTATVKPSSTATQRLTATSTRTQQPTKKPTDKPTITHTPEPTPTWPFATMTPSYLWYSCLWDQVFNYPRVRWGGLCSTHAGLYNNMRGR